ncbi:Protein SABRE [Thecaphora frezii]
MHDEPGAANRTAAAPASGSAWRIFWTVLVLVLLTGLFFRSVLPRMPQLFLRGRLRINRIGIRGVRGVEWRSRGFSHDARGARRSEDRLQIKVQRIYAVFQRPRWSRSPTDGDETSAIRSRSLLTIHVRGVGVRLSRSQCDDASLRQGLQKAKDRQEALEAEAERLRRAAEDRIDSLLRSSDDATAQAQPPRNGAPAAGSQGSGGHRGGGGSSGAAHERAVIHRAGALSLHTALRLVVWTRSTAIPAARTLVLRFVRAALLVVTSSLPSLTSLVDVQVHRVEIYVQEAETVARIGRAGIEFSMALVPAGGRANANAAASAESQAIPKPCGDRPPSWLDVFRAAARMPNRIGSGARGAASYLMGGLPDGKACLRVRVEGVQLFEADLDAGNEHRAMTGLGFAPYHEANALPSSVTDTPLSRPGSPLPRSGRRHASNHSRSGSLTNIDATPEVMQPGKLPHDWPDPGSPQSLSPVPTLKRSNSVSMLGVVSSIALNGFTDRWADWALEPLADSDFSADTGWSQDANGPGRPTSQRRAAIPESARLLSLPGVSEVQIGLLLGTSFTFRAKERVDIAITMCETTVGMDAVSRVASILASRKTERSAKKPSPAAGTSEGRRGEAGALEKRLVQSRATLSRTAAETLAAFAFSVPAVKLTSTPTPSAACSTHPAAAHARLPEALVFEAELTGFHLEIGTSSPSSDMHQRWLGACGVKDHHLPLQRSNAQRVSPSTIGLRHHRTKSAEGRAATHTPLASSRQRRRELVEHRRAFVLDAGLASFELHCRLKRKPFGERSELLFVGDLALNALSTWTPFGLLAARSHANQCPPICFSGDFNEETAVVSAGVGRMSGDVRLEHLTEILRLQSFVEAKRDAAAAGGSGVGVARAAWPDAEKGRLRRIPRLIAGIEVNGIEYTVDVSSRGREEAHAHQERKLTLSVPNFGGTFCGEYRDEYAKRPEAERRAAYKALKKDALEWPLRPGRPLEEDATEDPGSPIEEPADASKDAAEIPRDGEEVHLAEFSPSDDHGAAVKLTMDEALRRTHELQGNGVQPGQQTQQPAARNAPMRPGRARLPSILRRPSAVGETVYAHRYQFEASFRIEAIEAYLSLSGDRTSSRRGFYRPVFGTEAPEVGSSQHHLLALHMLELNGSGAVYGNVERCGLFDEIEAPWIHMCDGVADMRGSVEDIDVELWHPAALQAYLYLSESLVEAKAPLDPSLLGFRAPVRSSGSKGPASFRETPSGARETTAEPHDPVTGDLAGAPSLIDRLPGGLTVYLSVGSAIAHLGGTDPQCDPQLSRGIGLESRRIVLEYSAATEVRTNALQTKGGWGSRSALELPQDLRLQAVSLLGRHRKAALARITFFETGLFPILDAVQAMQQHMEGTANDTFAHAKDPKQRARSPSNRDGTASAKDPSSDVFSNAMWDFHGADSELYQTRRKCPRFRQQDRSNFIFWMPVSAFKATVRPPRSGAPSPGQQAEEEVTITSEDSKLLSFKLDLLHTYCLLLTVSTLRDLVVRRQHKDRSERKRDANSPKSDDKGPRPKPAVGLHISFNDVHISVTLPQEVHLFLRVRRLELKKSEAKGLSVAVESVLVAVESPKAEDHELWEPALRLRDFKILAPRVASDAKERIEVNGDSAAILIPFGYQVNRIIDNASVAFKATKQLAHQFLSGRRDSIITPIAEEPKHLPDISLHVRILVVSAQDDPFETRLNIIWRAGYDENRAREEREAAFQAKVAEMLADQRSKSMTSFNVGSVESFVGANSSESDSLGSHSVYGFNDAQTTSASIEEARNALDAYNSSSWTRRCRNAKAEQARRQDAATRRLSGRLPVRLDDDLPIRLAPTSKSAPLFRSSMFDLAIDLGEPVQFEGDKLRDFIHEQGGGIPRDTAFSLLVPIRLRWRMKEWRISLRDYPMPLLHVPPPDAAQPEALSSWDLEADFVVAEQLGGPESIRHVPAVVVPAATGHPDAVEYGIMVPKVAMPVKLYGSPRISIQTSYPTRLVWGQSLQPAIQDAVRVFDAITSPPHDPSPKLGFWDKIPLVMHGRVLIEFKGEGDFNLHLKGSRDPYQITGQAAGWVKCWRSGVRIRIGYPNDDAEFFQILSHEFLLAVPDLTDYIDTAAMGIAPEGRHSKRDSRDDGGDRRSYDASLGSSSKRYMKDPTFSKVVLKLTNGVKWGAGMHLERTCDDESCQRTPKCQGEAFYRECRFFDRIPHWEVVTRTRAHFDSLPDSQRVDSFRGWRTDHIHFSLSVYSPENGLPDCPVTHHRTGVSNNFYLTPLAWAHFWAWMRLFSSAMSLPIRHGSLFPDSAPPSPKFGRLLGTIKYRIDLKPLFIAHQYMQFTKSDWAAGLRTFLGMKARLGVFRLDLHQRQQETVKEKPELGAPKIVFHKPFYEAEVDCSDIDLRMLCGQFDEPSQRLSEEGLDNLDDVTLEDLFAGDCSIPDSELDWVDLDDFVELEAAPLKDPKPKLKLYPALTCPSFNYYRKIDSLRERRDKEEKHHRRYGRRERMGRTDASTASEDRDTEALMASLERSKFGHEDSHTCLVGKAQQPVQIQHDLAVQRLRTIRAEMQRLMSGGSSSRGRDPAASSDVGPSLDADATALLHDLQMREKLVASFVEYLRKLQDRLSHDDQRRFDPLHLFASDGFEFSSTDLASLYHDLGNFDNRYFAHNPTLFFSNANRSVLLKYYYSSRGRRGYCHHMTATAVRYIRELANTGSDDYSIDGDDHYGSATDQADDDADEHGHYHDNHRQLPRGPRKRQTYRRQHTHGNIVEESSAASALHEMLEEALRYKEMDDFDADIGAGDPKDGISDEFAVKSSNVCLFLKPQIVLKSDVDERSTVVITALRARLHNYTVVDESCAEDSVNANVLRRNFFSLDGLQCFHPTGSSRFPQSLDGGIRSLSVPLETLIDLKYQTNDFDRIVPRTNASVFYDKFNKLRLSDSSKTVASLDANGEPKYDHLYHRMDVIRLKCPRFTVSANGDHFAALYNVVTDLILYRDPVHRDHAKRLEEIMFSHDFTDVTGLSEVVSTLQDRIRDTQDLIRQYHDHLDKLTEQGRLDLYALFGEFLDLVDELNIIMEAITAAQDSKGGADREKKSALRFDACAKDLSWNMMGDSDGQLLAKLALKGISFAWLNKADNSAANILSLEDLQALNVRPDSMFAEIITKYPQAPEHPMAKAGRFLDGMWSVLPPVGGISIIDYFELQQHPLRIQIEMRVGRQIMDYIFGSQRQRKEQESRQKKLQLQERKKVEQVTAKSKRSPLARLLLGHSKRSNQKEEAHLQSTASTTTSTSDLASLQRESLDSTENLRSDRVDNADDFEVRSHHSGGYRLNRGGTHAAGGRPSTPATRNSHSSEEDDWSGGQYAIARRNAAEMRSRAAAYRTFVDVTIHETIFCLSYKGEKQKSITDLYDVVFQAPRFGISNRTFGYVDLAEAFKREVFKAAWAQKTTLLKGVLTHKPQRRKAAIEHIKAIRHGKSKDALAPLDVHLQPPTRNEATSTASSSGLLESPVDSSLASRDSSSDHSSSIASAPVNIITTPAEDDGIDDNARGDDDDDADDSDDRQRDGHGSSDDRADGRHLGSSLSNPSTPSTTLSLPRRHQFNGSKASHASPSFKLGKFLSRNFRARSESGSGSVSSSMTASMSRNGSAQAADGSMSPGSSNGSHHSDVLNALRRNSNVSSSGSAEGSERLARPFAPLHWPGMGSTSYVAAAGSSSDGLAPGFGSNAASASASPGYRSRSSEGESGTLRGLFPRRRSMNASDKRLQPSPRQEEESAEQRRDATIRARSTSLFDHEYARGGRHETREEP